MGESDFLNAALSINAKFKNLSGLDYLRAMIDDELNYPLGKLLNMKVIAAGEGTTEIIATPSYQFYNPMMRIHGGYLATLVDAAMGSAVISKLPKYSTGAGTVQLNVHYIRGVTVESGKLHAKAQVIHAGRTMLTAQAEIFDENGILCVHGTGTFLKYPNASSEQVAVLRS